MSSCKASYGSGYPVIAVDEAAVDAGVAASCLVNLDRLLSLDWQRHHGQSAVRASPVHQGLHTFETLADC